MATAFVQIDDFEQEMLAGMTPGALKTYLAIKREAYSNKHLTAMHHLKMIAARIESTASNVAKWLRKLVEAGLVVIEAAESGRYNRLFVPRLAEQLKRYRPARPLSFGLAICNPAATPQQPENSPIILAELSEGCVGQERRVKSEESSVFSVEKTGQEPASIEVQTISAPALACQPDSGSVRVDPAPRGFAMTVPTRHDPPRAKPTPHEMLNISRARRGLPPITEEEVAEKHRQVKAAAVEHRKSLGITTPLPDDDVVVTGAGPVADANVGKMAWDKGVDVLTRLYSFDEPKARKLIGSLRKDAGNDDAKVLRAFTAAETEKPVDPVPWLKKAVVAQPPRS